MPKSSEASGGDRPPRKYGDTKDDGGVLGVWSETGSIEQSCDNEAGDRPTKGPGRPVKGLVRGTYSLKPENKQWVKEEAKRRLTTESTIVDNLISEKRSPQPSQQLEE